MHLYHLIFYKCKIDEIIHHIIFVVLGGLFQIYNNIGYISAFYHFFICGLPGGIDYYLLSQVKEGNLDKKTRIKLAVDLNIWLRAPGIIITWALVWICHVNQNEYNLNNNLILLFTLIPSIVNAQYYSKQVAIAYGKYL